ncbi:hypothetical protein [Litorihabitans aurantiacus]|uniref:Uncharacterized protein n=1 Tax=Litorihabitans aurantiacus TaxID=1930061 RepID=A0AA38CXU9_9MICO|nr:hypothetical protein [Litorihabitans aurantiacus]GMA33792.1 hypothetical protein GCM10025875_37840 [Litorihabitans aurantiacus]
MTTDVAEWPRVRITVADTTGEVTIGGSKPQRVRGEGVSEVRNAALAVVTKAAAELGRGLRVEATEPDWTFYLIVRPNGEVHEDAAKPAKSHAPAPGTQEAVTAPVVVVETPAPTGPAAPAPAPRRQRIPLPALLAGTGVLALGAGWLLSSLLTPRPRSSRPRPSRKPRPPRRGRDGRAPYAMPSRRPPRSWAPPRGR